MVETSRRVVITGLGSVTPIGNTTSAYWAGLCQGANGVAPITLFDASAHACRFAAEVKGFNPAGWLEPKEAKRWDRFCQFGVVAAKQAINKQVLAWLAEPSVRAAGGPGACTCIVRGRVRACARALLALFSNSIPRACIIRSTKSDYCFIDITYVHTAWATLMLDCHIAYTLGSADAEL